MKTYSVTSEVLDAQFQRETEADAIRQLEEYSKASPNVLHELHQYDPNDGYWSVIKTKVSK